MALSGKKAAWAAFFFNTAGPKKGKRAYVWMPVFPGQMPAKSRYSRGKPERGVSGALTANGAVVR
ncbi:hypothetical protein DXF96_14835 [Heyndrickxia coagulans]|nr:hypothetical protein CYJ15_09310 [Heyndrickxia coagulans]QDI62673.1 hypothetical protein DXF96_14835 [Heyndrickxia coagulans]